MDSSFLNQLVIGIFVSASASLLGTFAILKRMSLVGDALSHVALPGIALAIFLKINPFVGALAFLFLATIGIWLLEYRSQLSVDTIVGIFFTTSLAVGALFIDEPELLEALFGDIAKVTQVDVWISIILSLFLMLVLLVVHRKLALHMVASELAQSIGVKSKQLEFIYLMLFALGVALGIKFIGALLMGALIIIPAAAAKNVARSLNGFLVLAVVFGVISAAAGVYVANFYNYSAGPIFILCAAAIFLGSLVWKAIFR